MFRVTQVEMQKSETHFVYGAITLWGVASQQLRLYVSLVTLLVQVRRTSLTTLVPEGTSLGSSHFARRYYGNH